MTPHEVEIQGLRTKINILTKCIHRIEYRANHIKKEPYDYGEADETALGDITQIILDLKYSNTVDL